MLGSLLILIAAVAAFDLRVAHWMRGAGVQGGEQRQELVRSATVVNEVPLTIAAVATYGVGRLTRQPTVTDVGAHVGVSLIATTAVAEVIRVGSGRARPRHSPVDPFVFEPGRGLREFEYRSFPSLHAAVANATAAALVEEMRHRQVNVRWAGPALYAAAAIPGLTRLYLDQHWASDVVAGTALGVWVGRSVVRRAHSRRTRIDDILIPRYAGVHAGTWTAVWSLSY